MTCMASPTPLRSLWPTRRMFQVSAAACMPRTSEHVSMLSLHSEPGRAPGRARRAVAHYITQRVGRWTTEARCWEQGRSIEEMRGERRVITGSAAECADVLASLQAGWRLPYVATNVALPGLTPPEMRRSMERLAAQVVPQDMKPAPTMRRLLSEAARRFRQRLTGLPARGDCGGGPDAPSWPLRWG